MNPQAFKLFGIPVMWYGVIITFGVLVGLFVLYINCRRSDGEISFDDVADTNILKINSRLERHKLNGDGDNR